MKIIKTESQHQEYLQHVHNLMSKGDGLSQVEEEQLDVLTLLLENYENNKYPIEVQDPIEAILFRMEEKGLKQVDLIPYFGTRSRVSEVLNKKRPLTVQMIRALAIGFGLSADTLIGLNEVKKKESETSEINWAKFPIKEMQSRGWINKALEHKKTKVEDVVKSFISGAGLQFGAASFRRTIAGEANSPSNTYALNAWLARVVIKARKIKNELPEYKNENISSSFFKEIVKFSGLEQGPVLAVDYLKNHGIAVVFERHLKGTFLDGAALKDLDGTPIIGITLRHDRLDNFWFTLLHELAHVWKHLDQDVAFLDDNESVAVSEDRREIEANRIARDALIPRLIWKRSGVATFPSETSIHNLSDQLGIHPAIVAGRIRKETSNYQRFSNILGHGTLSPVFLGSNMSEDC